MRFTRAAKVAAFPLTALILVALVACQGPAGPAGKAGGKGEPGTMGAPGTPGAPGINQIVRTSKALELILLNRGELHFTLGSATAVVDVTGYFRGGKRPLTYALVPTMGEMDTVDADDAIFKVALDPATGQLTVKAKTPKMPVVDGSPKYAKGETVTIKATDVDKIAAAGDPVILTIKPNKPPVAGADIAAANALTVGTQNAKDALRDGRHDTTAVVLPTQPNPVCATFASCVFTIKLQDGVVGTDTTFYATLTRYDETTGATATLIGQATTTDVIKDDDTVGMTFSIVDYDETKVLASASGNKIMIGGVKSTWMGDADVPTTVTIMARDANDLTLTVEHEIPVTVDAAPTLSKTTHFLNRYTFDPGQTASVFGRDVGDYFDDMESHAALTYTITSSNHAVADPPDEPLTENGPLVMLLAQGTATVTITATDLRGQTVKAEFVFNVNSP